jgi:hypothetical protein
MLVAEDDDGSCWPVAVALTIREPEELAESDLNERMRELERGEGWRQRPIRSGDQRRILSSRRPLETKALWHKSRMATLRQRALADRTPLARTCPLRAALPLVSTTSSGRPGMRARYGKKSNSTPIRARLSANLSPHTFITQPDRSIRVRLAFCQLEVALRELARKGRNAIA